MQEWQFLTMPGLELRHSVMQPVASSYTGCVIAALLIENKKVFWKPTVNDHKLKQRKLRIIEITYLPQYIYTGDFL
jgi:hypothetical protein